MSALRLGNVLFKLILIISFMIFVLTGNGKGKTTSAFGMALRAAGAGKKVLIVQFLKTGKSSEIKAIKQIQNIEVKSFGKKGFIENSKPSPDQKRLCQETFEFAKTSDCDMLILDEINIALHFKILDIKEVMKFLKEQGQIQDIVLTGRYCPKKIMGLADLISEIKEKKHYYQKGKKATKGIEY